MFEIRRKKGRTRRRGNQSKEESKSALNQDVGQLISRLFSKKK
jgi:hypothetical protein